MHEREKSDPAIGAGKPTNKADATSVAVRALLARVPLGPHPLLHRLRSIAVNFSSFLSLAAFRTRSSACDTRSRPCVR
jgi:hypothetical protein